MNRFPVGTEVSLHGTFHVLGTPHPCDPASVIEFIVKRPDGSRQTLTPDRLAQGEFAHSLLLDAPGRWVVRCATDTAAAEQEFFVETMMEP